MWLSWANWNLTVPLTSSSHISMAIFSVLTCCIFQKEIGSPGRYLSDQRETLWCLWGLNPLYRPWLLAKPISPYYHVVHSFLRTGKLVHSSFDSFSLDRILWTWLSSLSPLTLLCLLWQGWLVIYWSWARNHLTCKCTCFC